MKIVFALDSSSTGIPVTAYTADERPLGGIETGVIRLTRELYKLGVDIRVVTPHDNPPLSLPIYLPLKAIQHLGPVDILVAVRNWRPLFWPVNTDLRFLWTGDSFDQQASIGIGDKRVVDKTNLFMCVSKWHADTFCAASGFPREKTWDIRNGICLPFFDGEEERTRKRLIYSSTPFRGLVHLLSIFPKILERHPDAELHLFTGYEVYSQEPPREYKEMMERFSQIPNVTVHGNVIQKDLAREFMKSSILAYPNTFDETSCITAMEAQAAGCVPVTTNSAGLIETVGDGGILIDGHAGTAQYDNAFVEAVCELLSDDEKWQALSDKGKERAKIGFGWDYVAKRFLDEIFKRFP